MMEAVLTCSALTKAYGPNKALDNFTAGFFCGGGPDEGPVFFVGGFGWWGKGRRRRASIL